MMEELIQEDDKFVSFSQRKILGKVCIRFNINLKIIKIELFVLVRILISIFL
jgi:hypothetical protein